MQIEALVTSTTNSLAIEYTVTNTWKEPGYVTHAIHDTMRMETTYNEPVPRFSRNLAYVSVLGKTGFLIKGFMPYSDLLNLYEITEIPPIPIFLELMPGESSKGEVRLRFPLEEWHARMGNAKRVGSSVTIDSVRLRLDTVKKSKIRYLDQIPNSSLVRITSNQYSGCVTELQLTQPLEITQWNERFIRIDQNFSFPTERF